MNAICHLLHICELLSLWKGVSFYFLDSYIQISSDLETIWATVDYTFQSKTVVVFDTSFVNWCWQCSTLWVRISLRRGVLYTTLWYIVCQWLATGRWFSPGSPVSETNNTDRQDITEILLKVALITIKQPVFLRKIALDTIWNKSRNLCNSP